MLDSAKHPTPARVKRALRRARLTQARGAALIGKSTAMVSMVLNKKAKSAPVLRALFEVACAAAKDGNGDSA